MEGLRIDAKAALRNLAKRPFTLATAVLCLALGLGANATMLRVLDHFFFRAPALVSEPKAIRRLYFSSVIPGHGQVSSGSTSYPGFADLRGAKAFSQVAAFIQAEVPVGTGDMARKVKATLLSKEFFDLLGVSPLVGRTFSPGENQGTAGAFVAVVSERFWKRYHSGQSGGLGQLRIGRDLYSVVGVMPRRFTGVELEEVDVWLPLHAAERLFGPKWFQSRGSSLLDVIGRLRPGASAAAAEEELTNLYHLGHSEAGEPRPDARVLLGPVQRAWGPGMQKSVRVSLWLALVSFAVLLIADANVANLLIIRSIERRRELAIRLALGATRGRLVSVVLFESVVLATLGGLGALLVMYLGGASFRAFLLPEVPLESLLDFRAISWLAALVLLTGIACGIAPAVWESRRAPIEALKEDAGSHGLHQANTRWSFVSAQVTLTLVLLVGTGLFVRSLQNLDDLQLGIDPDRVLVATLDLQNTGYTPMQARIIYRQALERVRHLPEIQGASMAATVPLVTSLAIPLRVPGHEPLPQLSSGGPYVNGVSDGFFSTLGTKIRQGRAFTPEDRRGSAPVAMVNETFARLVWPGRNPLGQCIILDGAEVGCSTVIGVVQDTHRVRLQEPASLQVYVPLDQAPSSLLPQALLVRVSGDPILWFQPIRRELQVLAPSLPWIDVYSLTEPLAKEVQPWTQGVTVFSIFGSLALILAAVGIYASISYSLAQRQHEMGVRLALGAPWRDLVWCGLGGAARFVGIGVTIGVCCVLVFGDLVEPILLEVRATDPAVLLGSVLVLVMTAALAGYLPTRKLRQIHPAEVLRPE